MHSSREISSVGAVLVAIAMAVVLSTASARADETCVTCHSVQRDPRLHEPVTRMGTSVHATAIGCSGCHGGRANEPTAAAHDPNSGFVAHPSASVIADRCGSCHADARFIRRFSGELPTDQLALFHGTPHGQAMSAGNASAPTCTTCHGSHDVRPATDPASRVSPMHVAETCAQCHADATRMAGTHLTTNQVALWTESVHGRAVLQDANPRAPTCVGCHGAHGEFREAGGPEGRCRHCHEDEAAAFDRSPHASVYRRLGFSGCVACHGSHDIREAHGTLGTAGGMGVCRQCHADGRASFELARQIANDAESARRDLDEARAAARHLDEDGLRVPVVAALIDDASHAEIRLRVALHALDVDVVHEAAQAVRTPAHRARDAALRARSQYTTGRRAWLFAIPLLGLFIALSVLKIRRLDRARKQGV